ncbi:hypothetical protein DFH11DRAFT_1514709 [Phellopilus nigrolimitatus]|nr:hypothetical protein DFH11DRAFT_1514709 [Phellopilus nigrolimitatus]
MAPNPTCSALAAAKDRKGLSYAQIATAVGTDEQTVINACTGQVHPIDAKLFDALARVLDIKAQPAHTGVHATA